MGRVDPERGPAARTLRPPAAAEPTAGLGTFVEKLADPADGEAFAGPDAATVAAADEVRARIEAGRVPVGLRRLAEALAEADPADAAIVTRPDDRAPAPHPPVEVPRQRGPVDSAPRAEPAPDAAPTFTDVVAAVREESLLVLEGHRPAELVAAVGELAAAGLRVAVTAADPARLEAFTATVDHLPGLTGAQQRELRLLLATATPAREARAGRRVPPPLVLPAVSEVRALCRHAAASRGAGAATGAAGLLRDVLNTLDEFRLGAVAQVARAARVALDGLGQASWRRPLVADLVHDVRRPEFEELRRAAARALTLADAARDLPTVTLGHELPPHASALLTEYLRHLESGGRVRRRFAGGVQREVQPLLDRIRVGGETPADVESVRTAVRHLELAEILTSVDEGCARLRIPPPHAVGDLRALVGGLDAVHDAVAAVGRLRHDVLFLHPTSPVQVPDLAAAEAVADGILDVAAHGSAPEAAARLDALAGQLAGSGAAEELVAEHRAAVEALRARDAEGYAAAVAGLEAARREATDQARCDTLVAQLRADSPQLARDWVAGGRGLLWTVPLDDLLGRLPADDALDALVVLDAAELAMERLLVAAAAPRLLAVAGPDTDTGATLLGALERAAAPRVTPPRPPDPGGRVVHLPTARRTPHTPRLTG